MNVKSLRFGIKTDHVVCEDIVQRTLQKTTFALITPNKHFSLFVNRFLFVVPLYNTY